MDLERALMYLPLSPFFESLLPDFILGFTFFTALTYAVVGRRFDHQRSAIAMSAAAGLALAIGLVWWEYQRGWSARNLGPAAVGFAVIILAMIMFQAIRQSGGTWSGACIAFGASILVAAVLGVDWPMAPGLIQGVALVALTIGLAMLFLNHQGGMSHPPTTTPMPRFQPAEMPRTQDAQRDLGELHDDYLVADRLRRGLHHTRHQTDDLQTHPEHIIQVMAQIRAILPAEGWLTDRLAQLRARAHRVREGHIAQLEETKRFCSHLPRAVKTAAAADLVRGYKKIVGIDTRLERLDNAVAENERRIRALTGNAQQALARHDFNALTDLLRQAEKLQRHNGHLLRRIEATEAKLGRVIQGMVKQLSGANEA